MSNPQNGEMFTKQRYFFVKIYAIITSIENQMGYLSVF